MDSSWGHPHLSWRKAEGLKICVTSPGMQQPGEVWNPPADLGLTLSLPDWTWKLLKLDIVVSIVSTCILHDNIAGGILMFCKLWTLWALCLCDRAVPKHPNFLSQELTQSPVRHHLQYSTANPDAPWTCEVVSWVGVVKIVFDIIVHICLFNPLLLCSTTLNEFMSKNHKYIADTDTTHRVLRFQCPSLFFQLTCSFQLDYTYH